MGVSGARLRRGFGVVRSGEIGGFLESQSDLSYIQGEPKEFPMGVQEQAFRTYYATMSDAKLLETAAHKSSFIGVAQKVLAEELDRRHIALSAEPSPPASGARSGPIATLVHKLKHPLAH